MFNDVTCHRAAHEAGKLLLDPFGRHTALEQFEILRIIDPDIDVRCVAFVASAGVRNIAHENPLVALAVGHVTQISNVGCTKLRSMRTDFVSTADATTPPPAPPPAHAPVPNAV